MTGRFVRPSVFTNAFLPVGIRVDFVLLPMMLRLIERLDGWLTITILMDGYVILSECEGLSVSMALVQN